MFDLIIIGGGPAGISAGIYAARKKMKTLLITKDFSGQIGKTSEVDNYPGLPDMTGIELADKFEKHLKKFKSDSLEILENQEVVKVDRVPDSVNSVKPRGFLIKTGQGKKFQSRTIIAATGRDPRPLEIPGEKELIAKGVSYCSICDSALFPDKTAVVIGGGNYGFEAGLDLAKYASKIFIFEKTDYVRADEILQDQVRKEPKIKVQTNIDLQKINGRNKVESITYKNNKTGKVFSQAADCVFVAIGSIPATGFLKGLVKFNKWDEVVVNPATCASSCPGLFAAGDINDSKWKQVATAVGEGCRAVLEVYEYLRKH